MNEALAQLERLRGPDSSPWPPHVMLLTARAIITCLTPLELSDRERGLGITAESLQLLLLEIANSNDVSGGGSL